MPEETKSDNVDSLPTQTTSGEDNASSSVSDSSSEVTPTPADATTAPETSTAEIVQQVLKEQDSAPQPEGEGQEGSDAFNESSTEKKKEGTEEEPEPSVEPKEGPVPYARFKEENEKAKDYEKKWKEVEPVVTAAKQVNEFLASNGISEEEYRDTLHTLALLKRDPKAGLARLKPLVESLQQFDDSYLPPEIAGKIARLKTRVDEGELSADAAKELEEAWRGQAKHSVSQNHNRFSEAQQQQQRTQSIVNAASQWDSSMRSKDPDYKPKAKTEDPDGVFELTRKGFMYEVSQKQITNPQDLVSLLEKAYNDAKSLFTTRLRPPATKPAPTTSRSSITPRKEPKTADEVVADTLKKHGIQYAPRAQAA